MKGYEVEFSALLHLNQNKAVDELHALAALCPGRKPLLASG
jgi:hypothetical protein